MTPDIPDILTRTGTIQILAAIADRPDTKRGLADRLDISTRTVGRRLDELDRRGWLAVVGHAPDSRSSVVARAVPRSRRVYGLADEIDPAVEALCDALETFTAEDTDG